MFARFLPAALVFCAAAADGRGRHELAYWLVVAAVPAAAVGTLDLFGSLVDVAPGSDEEARGRALCTLSTFALTLVVLAAAVRSPARLDAGVPALGTSALAAAICMYAFQGLVVLGAYVPELRLAFARR